MKLTMENLQNQIDEIKKEMKDLRKEKNVQIRKKFDIGDTFELVGLKWKILDKTEKGYMCLAEIIENGILFDENSSDWKKSSLKEYLNGGFLEKLSDEVGKENIISFERDLFSLDGQTEYGSCEDKVSLLTVDEYRKYRSMIPNTNDSWSNTNDSWWWLITPWSTPCNNYERSVVVVSPSGNFFCNNCFSGCGVRPFCIFSSSIFESED